MYSCCATLFVQTDSSVLNGVEEATPPDSAMSPSLVYMISTFQPRVAPKPEECGKAKKAPREERCRHECTGAGVSSPKNSSAIH